MAQRSRSRTVRRRNRRLSRYFVYLAYAGTAIVALAQVIAALGQIVGFLDRVFGALGQGTAADIVVEMDEQRSRAPMIRAPMIRSPMLRPGLARRGRFAIAIGTNAWRRR